MKQNSVFFFWSKINIVIYDDLLLTNLKGGPVIEKNKIK